MTSPLEAGVAADDVPRLDHEVVAGLEFRVLGQAAGGDDDDVGGVRIDHRRVGVGVVVHGHAEPFEFGDPPVDDAQQVLAARVARGEAHLAAGPRHRLEHGDDVSTLGAHAGGLQPTGAGTDHHDPAQHRRPLDLVRHRQLAAGGRVVDAERLARLVDPVEAVRGAHARADGVLDTELDLAHEVRVGHVRSGHADHVDLALAHRVAGGGDVVDLGRVEHGDAGLGAHHPGEVEVRCGRHAVDGDHVAQRPRR